MGKGIPDKFDIDADVHADVHSTSLMDAEVTMNSNMAVDATMRLPDPVRAEVTVAPLRTEMETVSRLAITEPIRTEMQMDVKPVVLDLCLNLGLNKLPRMNIKRPYNHCLTFRVLGTELASVSLWGQQDMIVDDPEARPAVAWGSKVSGRDPRPHDPRHHDPRAPEPRPRDPRPAGPHRPPPGPRAVEADRRRGGLRIRLGD